METKGVRTHEEVRVHDMFTRRPTIKTRGVFHTVGKLYWAPVIGLWLVNASTILKMVCELFPTQPFPLEHSHYWCSHSVLYNSHPQVHGGEKAKSDVGHHLSTTPVRFQVSYNGSSWNSTLPHAVPPITSMCPLSK